MSFAELLAWILPLTLLASLSPLMLVQSATIELEHGPQGVLQYLAGNVVVMAALGTATMGLLGVAASDWVSRELASKRVDAVLAGLLLVFGLRLLVLTVREHRQSAAANSGSVAIPSKGLFTFGLLGAATDLSGLPIYISIAQRIGVTAISWPERAFTLLVVTTIVLCPAWLPLALPRARGLQTIVTRIGRQLSVGTRWATMIGCFLGAGLLALHAFS